MARTTVSSFFYAFTFLQILASSQAAWLPRTNVLPRQAGAPPPAAIPPQCESVCTPALAALQVCIVSRFWFMAVIIELVDFELPGMHPSYSVLYVLTPLYLACKMKSAFCRFVSPESAGWPLQLFFLRWYSWQRDGLFCSANGN